MNKTTLTAVAVATALMSQSDVSHADAFVPADVKQTCPIDSSMLKSWSSNGQLSANTVFNAADSVNFDDSTACNFYRWSWQMFLWLTSQPSGGDFVFDGDMFFDVNASTGEVFENNDSAQLRANKYDSTEQAGGPRGVLFSAPTGYSSKYGSLVYFSVDINDVFNAQAKQTAAGTFPAGDFITTQTQLDALAKGAGVRSFPDGQALTMELKTSWIVLGDKMDASQFLDRQG